MKKRVIILLFMLSILALSGCGNGKKEEASTKENGIKKNEVVENLDNAETPEEVEIEETDLNITDEISEIRDESGIVSDTTDKANAGDSVENQTTEDGESQTSKEDQSQTSQSQETQKPEEGQPQTPESGQSGASGNGENDTESNKTPSETESSAGNGSQTESSGPVEIGYEEFQSMSPKEQQEYMESFPSIEAFFEWYNEAKERYLEENPPIDIDDGNVDL